MWPSELQILRQPQRSPPLLDEHGEDEQKSTGHGLVERAHIQEQEPVLEHAENGYAQQGSRDRADPARQGVATESYRRYRQQRQVSSSRFRDPCPLLRGQDDAGDPGHETHQGVDAKEIELDVDTGQTSCLLYTSPSPR